MSEYINNSSVVKSSHKQVQYFNNSLNNNIMNFKNKQIIEANDIIQMLVIETEEHIKFINEYDSKNIVFQFPTATLSRTFSYFGIIHSYWIDKISKMDWATNDLLYELAAMVNKDYPTNKIHWYFQFYKIGSEEYNEIKCQKKQFRLQGEFTVSHAMKILLPFRSQKYNLKVLDFIGDKFEYYGLIPNDPKGSE